MCHVGYFWIDLSEIYLILKNEVDRVEWRSVARLQRSKKQQQKWVHFGNSLKNQVFDQESIWGARCVEESQMCHCAYFQIFPFYTWPTRTGQSRPKIVFFYEMFQNLAFYNESKEGLYGMEIIYLWSTLTVLSL